MENNIAESSIFNEQLGNSIKDEFLAHYKRMGEVLSSSSFEEFLKVLQNEEITINADAAVEAFRNHLTTVLTESFNSMWGRKSMTENLSLLDFLKKKYATRPKPQWRPYGKSAVEQTLPLRVRLLEKKSAYLDKQLTFQKEELESVVVRVEENRKAIESLEQRRSRLTYNMDVRRENFERIRKELVELQLKAIDASYP